MRRYLALMPVFAALVASLGCCHIGGKSDCGYNPSDYPIHAPTDSHPSAPVAKPVPPVPPKGGGNE